jgi:hypothetical protein
MPLGVGSGFWAIALPVEKTNATLNPSYEYGTLGVTAIQSSTLGSSAQYQQFGAWSLAVTPNSNGTSGAALGTWTATNGAAYTASVYVRGVSAIPYRMAVADSNGVNFVSGGTTTFTGGGTWQRYSVSFTEAAGAVRRVVVTKSSGADTTPFYVDGYQIELGSLTTYIDGDQPGCIWNGGPHASMGSRSGQTRAGGSLVALADLGWSVDQMPGVGMPGLENSSQSYAVLDGAQYQRTRATQRAFTLTAKPIYGTTTADYHVQRRTIIDAIKIDAFSPQQPSRFYYVGGQGTVLIDAVYDHGLELGNMDGPMAEDIAVSFAAFDPYWYAPTNEGTALAANTNIGSTNYIVKRSPTGVWGTLGVNGTTVNADVPGNLAVYTLTANVGGSIFVGGYFGTAGGTWSNGIAMYLPDANRFGTLTGGSIGNGGGSVTVRALQFAPSGSLFIAGNTLTHGGTVSPNVGFWNGAYGTLTGGTVDVNNQAYTLTYSPTGTLFLGGDFAIAGGTVARRLAQWANGVWGTLSQTGGTIDALVSSLVWGLDSALYAAGAFSRAGGTTLGSIARWNGAWGSLAAGGSGGNFIDLGVKPDGRIVGVGDFVNAGGVLSNGIAEWNGAGWTPVASGVTGPTGATARLYAVGVRQNNSYLVAGSFTRAGGLTFPDPLAEWNGASFLPIGIDLPGGAPIIYTIYEAPDRTLYLGGAFTGTALAASAGAVVNTGRAQVYPIVRMRNTSGSSGTVWYLQNFTTNTAIYFDLALLPGEVATLTLTPGARSFTSSFRSNLMSAILPGSNLATWALAPGTNNLAFYADNTGLVTSLYWQPRSWSADGGTVY